MDLRPYLNRNVIIGALSFTGTLLIITLIIIGWTSPRFSPDVGFAPADLTIIPAPTHTPNVTAIPTTDPLITPTHQRLRSNYRHRRPGITHPLIGGTER